MKIAIDAHGGDNGAKAVVDGAVLACMEYDCEIILVGELAELTKLLSTVPENARKKITITDARNSLDMHAESKVILKGKRDSSMAVALTLVAEGAADACVSGGNTGALVMGGTFIVKRIPGLSRAALATVMPSQTGACMLLDVGANSDCKPEMLLQFGMLGSLYMEKVMKIDSPKVGLLNIGTEEHKGIELYVESNKLMREKATYNFIGNIEGRDFPMGVCDVVVCDGFTGNIALKVFEGVGLSLYQQIKGVFLTNILTKFAALLCKKGLKAFKKKMDYKEYGGAPLLGLCAPVIKAHGNSDSIAFKNAIRQAIFFLNTDMISEIKKNLEV